ncbi:formin homology 2 domain containing isoform X4 [Musca autumnalis]|uniref:formin homology 2 domain containing isoform X4 n=1 Tax=Musca autumnalis TaxID=221902 RepID=UPI003CE750CF
MSSYRSSYTPFKSSLPSTYKSSTTSSSYSSRDDISGTSRYTSSALASPSSYRPSFSGGTYRLKRDTPTVSTTSSYVSRYTPSSSAAASSTTLAKADSSSSDMKSVSQLKRYGSTSSSIGKYSREPSPAALEHTNRMRSRDPSPGIRSLKGHSRDPSPGMDNKYKVGYGSSYRMNMPKTSTSASTPTTSSYSSTRYGATRTPSSTSVAEKTSTTRTASSTSLADKTKGYGATNRTPSTTSLAEKSLSYGTASARRTPSTTSLAEKPLAYGSSNARPTSSATSNISYGLSSRNSSSSIKPTEEKPLASEGRPRTTSNQSSISYLARDYQTNQNDIPQQVPVQVPQKCESPKTTNTPAKPMESKDDPLEEDEDSESTEESDTSEDDELPEPPKELFLSVTVCTRGTSPNPPGSQTSGRPTQSLAITIEKTILRSTSKRKMVEKEMQSEECTKVTRYGHNSRLSPFNPPAEKRRSPSNLRYSSSPLSTTSKSTSVTANDSRREDSTTSSSSPSRTTKTASPTTTKSKLSPPRVGRLKSRQSSVESLSPKKPPVGPKAESPFKSPSPSSLSPGPSRLPNKDFRKSSLNVGPTDRTRKSRTPSTGTDSDFNTIDALNGALQAIQRLERSPSACSEISVASNRSARLRNMSSENKLRPRCLSKTLGSRTPPSPLSRQNSNTSIKPVKSPLAASPLAMRSNKILVTAATSSSSGTESSAAEPKKPHKKIVKKKVVKLAQAPASSSTSTALSSTNNSDNQSSPTTSSTANKRSLPQPKAAVGGTSTAIPAAAATKKTESSPLKKSASTSSRTEKDPLRRLKKLSSVSNFFVAQQKNANSDDQIYLESTETSGGGSASGGGGGEATSTDLDVASTKSSKKSISLLRANETKTSKSTTPATPSNDSASSASNRNSPAVQYTRENSASERSTRISKSSAKSSTTSKSKTKSKSSSTSASTSSSSGGVAVKNKLTATKMPIEQQSESYGATTGTTSTGGTDSEEPSWWQDTSQQIDTSSALDCSFKDEMRFKVRHVDSGETAWWLRNDDEATLADDVATINQDEEDAEQKSNKSQEPGWWETTDDINDPNEGNEYQNDKNISFSDLDYKSKTYFNDHQEITDSESRPFPRSRLTPETDWWNDDDEEDDTNAKADELPKEKHLTSPPTPAVQNGTIQLKICRVESTDAAWWQQDESEGGDQTTTSNAQEEQKPSVEPETSSATTSSSSSMSAEPKKWWMTGPAKKLFNIPRVESGEKAWWQTENSDKESQHSKKSPPQERNTNPETESMAPQNSTIKKLFNLPRVESGEKAWWLEENSEKEDQHSNSQDSQQNNYQQPEEISNDPPPSASPPQNIKIKKLINIPRVESGEKAWWLEESPEQENKRSNSQDSECYPGLQETERQKSPNKKLFNLSRLDSDQEEESWWQHDGQERGKTRSRSRESEQEFRNSNRSDKRQQITPTKEQTNVWSPSTRTSQSPVKQIFSQPEEPDSYEANIVVEEEEVWPPPIGRTSESPMKRVFTQQQSLEEQKERWLQERNRHLQNQSTEDIYQNNPAGLEEPNYPHSYQLNTDDDDSHDHQTSFLPQNRVDSQTELSNSFNFEYSERPPPLGQCASPVHHEEEPPQRNNEPYCSSPYDNIPMTKVQQTPMANNAATIMDAISLMPISGASPPASSATPQLTMLENNKINVAAYQQTTMPTIAAENECGWRNVKSLAGNQRQTPPNQQYNQNDLRSKIERAFISRHQNIDELLSGACRPLSPMFFDNDESFQTMPPTQRNMFLEEITPDQVRIHDSRAQVSYIQRMDRDDWENKDTSATASKTPPRLEPRAIDDAALQVYKDGDFGAYLDLESSLAEQAEEIEGLNSSRKNSLVVRTQLSVRVHAIIEKLLSAEGSDLRRALFSLKQVFQEDKDLVHAFVALGGLNCLVRVGNGADQNYQNYILRALGQVMLYVDGMNGVMKHEPTMQWLYSLIASNYRSVVKTALKLLLVFVEYAESNCHVLVSAIHSVDKQQGTLPWSNIMRLLKDYDNADAELVIYAASLINKTLGGLSDQDSFYDESDLLEQQGMESVIQHYLSKPGTDIDLINQLQLYEAVLKFEDGESDGIRLPDNTLRKTQRFRNSTDTAERRKSRRHSTGTSPGNINKVLPTHSRLTPPQTILDEDSSSSTNSAEYANGVFVDKQHRDGAGVTPGLRRRRERAERHRSFLKEQQEAAAAAVAAANGYLNGLEKREELGQLVTAIPATVKSGDSPPESLTIIPECNGSPYQQHVNGSNQKPAYNNHINASANPPANSSHNNALLINTSSLNATNTPPNNNTSLNGGSNNHQQHHINLLSPTKQLLGTNTISIINNSFDKSNTNKLQQHNVNANNKKNIFMERNAINGMMKNIHRSNSNNGSGNMELSENYQPNGGENNLLNYKKFENNTNRLNSYYNQMNATPKNESPNKLHLQHHTNSQQQQSSPLSPTTPNTTPLTLVNIPTTPQRNTMGHCLSGVLSPKKTLNCSSPTSAGFDFTPKTSTPIASAAAAVPTAAKQLFDDGPATPHATTYTTSCSSGSASASTTALTSPQTSPGDYPPPPTSIAYNTITNTSVVPPPPPPPPPPPDLLGFLHMRPINFYNQTSPSSTTATTTTNTNNFSNNNNSNIATDAVDFLKISESDSEDKKRMLQLKRDHTVKDLTQKLCNLPTSPTHEDKLQNRIVGDMSGLISKAKEGLAKSKSKGEMSRASSVDQEIKKPEPKKSENELQWEELVRNMVRPLQLCDLDFTDLNSDDDKDLLAPRGTGRGVPPPPPPMGGVALPPPMLPQHIVLPPPMMSQSNTSNGSGTGYANSSLTNSLNSSLNGSINGDTLRKSKKTVKLFWKEVREDLIPPAVGKTIWDELPPATVDTQKLEHLFESRAKDLMSKEKQQEMNKSKEVIVLDHKRSNAINIAMTKLPPPRAIKAAILKMDATVVTREGIDKLLNMLPTDEEKGKIQEAQMANPELPLGSAEQFLLTLASISELPARLRLWAFRLDFDNSEREIAEPLMDLKHGIEILRNNRTFKCILSTLLSVGIFLNGAPVKGFQIEYLAKVPEVKDTVHKHSLLHHLCHIVMESGMETTDLYSEIGPITRASKADFNELAYNLSQLEHECKASWDRLKLMCKHDCPPQLQQKLVDFLADCAERIIILQIVHRRVMNRYRKFLLWLGVPQHSVADSRPNEFCRILSEFALEYRTTRERVQQQIEKKANHRERNKTRGKLIVDIAKFKTKEDKQDAELKELLGTPSSDNADGTLTWRRRRAENLRSPQMRQSEENFTDGDDEILESLVKTATKAPGNRTTPRERKRTRHADRKSLRRTLKNGLTEEEKLQVAALIKTY